MIEIIIVNLFSKKISIKKSYIPENNPDSFPEEASEVLCTDSLWLISCSGIISNIIVEYCP